MGARSAASTTVGAIHAPTGERKVPPWSQRQPGLGGAANAALPLGECNRASEQQLNEMDLAHLSRLPWARGSLR